MSAGLEAFPMRRGGGSEVTVRRRILFAAVFSLSPLDSCAVQSPTRVASVSLGQVNNAPTATLPLTSTMASLGPHLMSIHNQYPLLFQPNESVTPQKAQALFQVRRFHPQDSNSFPCFDSRLSHGMRHGYHVGHSPAAILERERLVLASGFLPFAMQRQTPSYHQSNYLPPSMPLLFDPSLWKTLFFNRSTNIPLFLNSAIATIAGHWPNRGEPRSIAAYAVY